MNTLEARNKNSPFPWNKCTLIFLKIEQENHWFYSYSVKIEIFQSWNNTFLTPFLIKPKVFERQIIWGKMQKKTATQTQFGFVFIIGSIMHSFSIKDFHFCNCQFITLLIFVSEGKATQTFHSTGWPKSKLANSNGWKYVFLIQFC